MSALTKGTTASTTGMENDNVVLLATANMQLNQMRSEYDEEDDVITSKHTTVSPPPTTNVTSSNSVGKDKKKIGIRFPLLLTLIRKDWILTDTEISRLIKTKLVHMITTFRFRDLKKQNA